MILGFGLSNKYLMTASSWTKCVILPTPLEWGSCINLRYVSKATRGMHWGTTTKKHFKWLFLFCYNTLCLNSKLVKNCCFLPAMSIIYYVASFLNSLQALILIICWSCAKLILDYTVIQKWPGSYSACSSDHEIKTWIYLNFNELHTLSVMKS